MDWMSVNDTFDKCDSIWLVSNVKRNVVGMKAFGVVPIEYSTLFSVSVVTRANFEPFLTLSCFSFMFFVAGWNGYDIFHNLLVGQELKRKLGYFQYH